MKVILKRGNDQVVTLQGLRAVQSGEYLNAATVMATLNNSRGYPIPAFMRIPMPYVAGSQGNYEWVIEGTTMMLPIAEYTLEITAEQEGLDYRIVTPVSVVDAPI